MAERQVTFAGLGPFIYDDDGGDEGYTPTDAVDTDGQMYVGQAPVGPFSVARIDDVNDVVVVGSGTVTEEAAFGQAASAGTANSYSRGDHTHGTPTQGGAITNPSGGATVDAEARTAIIAILNYLRGIDAIAT